MEVRTPSGGGGAAFSGGTGGAGDTDEVVVADGSGGIKTADTVKAGTGYVSIGATPAAAGSIRLARTGTIASRDQAGTGDIQWMSLDVSNRLSFGDTANNYFRLTPGGGDSVFIITGEYTAQVGNGQPQSFRSASNFRVIFTGTEVQSASPIVGITSESSPYGVHGAFSHAFASDANYVVTAAQYKYQKAYFETGALGVTGRTVTWPAPASLATGYSKFVRNNTTATLTQTTGAGTTVALLTNTGALLWFDSTGVSLMAPAL